MLAMSGLGLDRRGAIRQGRLLLGSGLSKLLPCKSVLTQRTLKLNSVRFNIDSHRHNLGHSFAVFA